MPPVRRGSIFAVAALFVNWFLLFLIAEGVSPTSDGCGTGRAGLMVLVAAVFSTFVYLLMAMGLIGLLREAAEPADRQRRAVLAATIVFGVGLIPLFVVAGLFGSCFAS